MEIVEAAATDAEELALLLTDWRRGALGEAEPTCTAAEAAAWFAPRPHRLRIALLAREGSEPVGLARMQLRRDRAAPGFVPELYVAPAFRRRGIGRSIVEALTERARANAAPSLILRQEDSDAGAAAFADALGAPRGFRGLQNRCHTAQLDPSLLQGWVGQVTERAAGWSLIGWDGRCPDDLLEPFVAVQSAMHGAPVPSVAVTGRSATDIRDAEDAYDALGIVHWVLAARQDDGMIGGFTELEFEPDQPWLAHQGDTAVLPQLRGLGLGRLLKARMALRLLAERPEVTQIETNTAVDNPPMRSINEAMGFAPVAVWQDRELALE